MFKPLRRLWYFIYLSLLSLVGFVLLYLQKIYFREGTPSLDGNTILLMVYILYFVAFSILTTKRLRDTKIPRSLSLTIPCIFAFWVALLLGFSFDPSPPWIVSILFIALPCIAGLLILLFLLMPSKEIVPYSE